MPSLYVQIGELAVANGFLCTKLKPRTGKCGRDDRTSPPHAVGRSTMQPAVDLAVVVLLLTAGRNRDELGAHATDPPAVPGNPFLRRPADDLAPVERGASCEPEAHPASDAALATDADLPEAQQQQAREMAQALPLPSGWAAVRSAPIRSGAPTSPTCRYDEASSTCSRSWTGSPARS